MNFPPTFTNRPEPHVQISVPAFVVAGVAQIATTLLVGMELGLGIAAPNWILDVTMPATFAGALLGLAGVSPELLRLEPRLARIGNSAVAFAVGGLLGTVIGKHVLGVVPQTSPLVIFPFILAISLPVSFLFIGFAILQADYPSETAGRLMLGGAGLQMAAVAGIVGVQPALLVGGAGLFGVVLLLIGYSLWMESGFAYRMVTIASSSQ